MSAGGRGVAGETGVGEARIPFPGPSLPVPCLLPAACLSGEGLETLAGPRRVAKTTPEVGMLSLLESQ